MEALRRSRAILLDSNLLVLYLVGLAQEALIGKHKRTQSYTIEDFLLLRAILDSKRTLVTTPGVLTEVSNLARQIGDPIKAQITFLLGQICQTLDERYTESARIAKGPHFTRLGLTDSGLLDLCAAGLPLLTDDLPLYVAATRLGCAAVNFNHIRTDAWQ